MTIFDTVFFVLFQCRARTCPSGDATSGGLLSHSGLRVSGASMSDDEDDDGTRRQSEGAEDIAALAMFALKNGLDDHGPCARRLAWPKLLGIDVGRIDTDSFAAAATRSHRDSHVVDADVERSLWAFTAGWSAERRDAKRRELRRVIDASVCAHEVALPGVVSYYQGQGTLRFQSSPQTGNMHK